MCGGGGGDGGAAAREQTQMLEAQQKKHVDAVGAGKTAIDKAFAQFDDGYFDNYGKSYKDAYNPKLTEDYGLAKDKLYATLAGTDQLGGSVGNNSMAQLSKTYANSQADIANKAADNENALRSSVDNTKTQLYGTNAAAADPLTMASAAHGAAGAIVAPSSYPKMSDVFGDALGSVATSSKAHFNSQNGGSDPLRSFWPAPV